jgi:hypothetical protein
LPTEASQKYTRAAVIAITVSCDNTLLRRRAQCSATAFHDALFLRNAVAATQ